MKEYYVSVEIKIDVGLEANDKKSAKEMAKEIIKYEYGVELSDDEIKLVEEVE